MEYHIVYRKSPDATTNRRQYQRAQLERVAVLSTYEEARLYVQMVALIDAFTLKSGRDEEYLARALPFDWSLEQLSPTILEYNGQGWKLDRFPWNAPFHEPFRFNGLGEPMAGWHGHRKNGFETNTESAFAQRMSAKETPELVVGELVFIRWNYGPDTYAVISALGTQNGPVQRLGDGDLWTGWYHLLYISLSGVLGEEYVHRFTDFEIQSVNEELPPSFRILELISRHLKGETVFSDDVLGRLTEGGVQVDGIEVFPFDKFNERVEDPTEPVQVEGKLIAAPIEIPVGTVPARRVTDEGRPELCSVYVVVLIDMNYGRGTARTELFDVIYPPAAFSSLAKAVEFAEYLRKYHLSNTQDPAETAGLEFLRQSYVDKCPLAVEPGFILHYTDRVQIMELLMPRETITDEDLVQSLAFEDLVVHTWCYNVDGAFLWESPAPEVPVFERYAFEGRFRVGDLVYVVPQGLDPESESIEGDVAVVSEVPVMKDRWLAEGNESESWNTFYTVDLVGSDDFLQHYHVPESSLLLARFPMRDTDLFLPLWSKHLRGELDFPDGLAERIRAQKVLLEKCPHYDFSSGCIIE